MYILMGLYSGFNFIFYILFVIVGIEITEIQKGELFNLLIYILFWGYSAGAKTFT